MLWLWCRPVATAQIGPLAWEPPYATGVTLKSKKKKKVGGGINSYKRELVKIYLQNSTDGTGIGYLKMGALVLYFLHVACFPLITSCLCFPFRTGTYFFSFSFLLFRAESATYESSQARGQIGAVATDLTTTIAMPDPSCVLTYTTAHSNTGSSTH